MGPELLQLVQLGMYIICASCWVAIPTLGHRWVSTGYPNYAVSMLSLTPKYRDIVAQIPHLGDKLLATSARSNPHPEAHFWDIKFYLPDILNTYPTDGDITKLLVDNVLVLQNRSKDNIDCICSTDVVDQGKANTKLLEAIPMTSNYTYLFQPHVTCQWGLALN